MASSTYMAIAQRSINDYSMIYGRGDKRLEAVNTLKLQRYGFFGKTLNEGRKILFCLSRPLEPQMPSPDSTKSFRHRSDL
ncbi:MAG TPA: hypothetical protein VN639_02090 [Azonexus sp.]|nr:hypothetical protein [Azonexus sp.]